MLPSIVQNQFVSTLADEMCLHYPALGCFIKSDCTQQMPPLYSEEEQKQLFESIIHLCFAYDLPVHKLLE